jgi:hypothetical protein
LETTEKHKVLRVEHFLLVLGPKRKRQETREKRKKYLEFKLVLLGVLQWNVIFSKPSFSLPILQQDEPNLLP